MISRRRDASATRGLVRALIANHRTDEAWTLMKQSRMGGCIDFTSRQLAWRWRAMATRCPRQEIVDAVKHGKEYVDTAIGMLADAKRWDDAAALLDRWGPPRAAPDLQR